jgi:hypothetical protein
MYEMKKSRSKYRIKPIIENYGIHNRLKFVMQKRWIFWWIDVSQPYNTESEAKEVLNIFNQYHSLNKR